MGFGYLAGGVAEGIGASLDRTLKARKLAADEARTGAYQSLREQALQLRQQQVADQQQRNLVAQVDKQVERSLRLVSKTIDGAKAAGKQPDEINRAIEPLLANIDRLSVAIGRDPSAIRTEVQTLIATPGSAPKVGSTVEGIRAKLSRGEQLTPGEQRVYDDARRMSAFDRLMLGLEGETGGAPAPMSSAPAATPGPEPREVQTTTVAPEGAAAPATKVPPVPENLKGKGAMWSPSKQRFYTPDGQAYNQQGVPVN